MVRETFTNDEVEQVLGNLFSGLSIFHASICEWLIDADLSQQFLADGARDLVQWVSARFGLRHSTAAQQVRVARRLEDLPVLRSRFASGEVSLDQVDAISKLATAETEDECVLSDHRRSLGIGRRSRLVPAWLRRQLWFRDGGCRFPGCGTRRFVHAHHENIGPMGDPPTWRIWSSSADITTDSFMSTSGPSKWIRTAGTPTENPMGSVYPPPKPGLDPRLREVVGQRT